MDSIIKNSLFTKLISLILIITFLIGMMNPGIVFKDLAEAFTIKANAEDRVRENTILVVDGNGESLSGARVSFYSGESGTDEIWWTDTEPDGRVYLDECDEYNLTNRSFAGRITVSAHYSDGEIELCSEYVDSQGVWRGANLGTLLETGCSEYELANDDVQAYSQEPTLVCDEPRWNIDNVRVMVSSSDVSKSENILRDYAHKFANVTNGHVIINSFELFSIDSEIEKWLKKENPNVVNEMAANNGFDICMMKHEKKGGFSSIGGYFDGGCIFCPVNNSSCAEILCHESGHYFLLFLDEYVSGAGYAGKKYDWWEIPDDEDYVVGKNHVYMCDVGGTYRYIDKNEVDAACWTNRDGKISRPASAQVNFGLMDYEYTDLEMSKPLDYLNLDADNPWETTLQHYVWKLSCEEKLENLLVNDLSTKSADYTSTKDHNGMDQKADYWYAGGENVAFSYTGASSKKINMKKTPVRNQTFTDLLKNCDISFSNNTLTIKADHEIDIELKAINDSFEFTTASDVQLNIGNQFTGCFSLNENYLYSISVSNNDSYEEYTIKINSMNSDDYNCSVALSSNSTDSFVTISNDIDYSTDESDSVTCSTYIISPQEDDTIGNISTSLSFDLDIDYSSLKWYRFIDNIWQPIETDFSYDDHGNPSAMCYYAGNGLYSLMAKAPSSETVETPKDFAVSNENTTYDNEVIVSFADETDRSNILNYNVYYSENPFTADDFSGCQKVAVPADMSEYTFFVDNADTDYYFAIEAVGISGSRSALSELKQSRGSQIDDNHDGIPNWWIQKYGFKDSVTIAQEDTDGDGICNLDEFKNGTNPAELLDSYDLIDEGDTVIAEEMIEGVPLSLVLKVGNALTNMKDSVDITNWYLYETDMSKLFTAVAIYFPTEYATIVNDTGFTYKIVQKYNSRTVNSLRFYYGEDVSLSTTQKRILDRKNEIDKILDTIKDMNDFEKALYVHDYIVLNCEYDYELKEINASQELTAEIKDERGTEYSVLVNGTGICGSYALTYETIMKAADIQCCYLSSDTMNHAWNLVKIDGNWYHVDTTWDDPTPDRFGTARREYFLRTDSEMQSLDHSGWSPADINSTSTVYSNMPRKDSNLQKYIDGYWYFYDYADKTVYRSDAYGNNKTAYVSPKDASFSSFDIDEGSFYYSKQRYIYKHDLSTDKSELVYFIPASKAGDTPSTCSIIDFDLTDENMIVYKSVTINGERMLQKDITEKPSLELLIDHIVLLIEKTSMEVGEECEINFIAVTKDGTKFKIVPDSVSGASYIALCLDNRLIAMNCGNISMSFTFASFTSDPVEVTINGSDDAGYCGKEGKNIHWYFENNILYFEGNGEMINYNPANTAWNNSNMEMTQAVFEEGISAIYASGISSITIQTITLPKTIMTITNNFYNCPLLQDIIVDNENPNWCSVNGILFSKDRKTIKFYPNGKTNEKYVIPGYISEIASCCFMYNENLSELVIPDNVKTFRRDAINKCKGLRSVTIPCSFKPSSGSETLFEDCYNIETVHLTKGTGRMSDFSSFGFLSGKPNYHSTPWYASDKIKEIIFDEGIEYIGKFAFRGLYSREMKTLRFPSTLKIIADSAFDGAMNLSRLDLPDSVQSVGDNAFRLGQFGHTKVVIHNPNMQIGRNAFSQAGVYRYSFAICAKFVSTAHNYAEDNGYKFVPTDAVMFDATSKFTANQIDNIIMCKSNIPAVLYQQAIIFDGNYMRRDTNPILNTNAVVNLTDGSGKSIRSYTMSVYGDVDGDGLSDGRDVLYAECIKNGMLKESDLNTAQLLAADSNIDGQLDFEDINEMISSGLFIQ